MIGLALAGARLDSVTEPLHADVDQFAALTPSDLTRELAERQLTGLVVAFALWGPDTTFDAVWAEMNEWRRPLISTGLPTVTARAGCSWAIPRREPIAHAVQTLTERLKDHA